MKLSESMWAYEAGFMVLSLFPEGNATPTPPMARFQPWDCSLSSPSPKREYEDMLPPFWAFADMHPNTMVMAIMKRWIRLNLM